MRHTLSQDGQFARSSLSKPREQASRLSTLDALQLKRTLSLSLEGWGRIPHPEGTRTLPCHGVLTPEKRTSSSPSTYIPSNTVVYRILLASPRT